MSSDHDNVRDLTENSRVQMAKVIAGLVNGMSVTKISEETGVPRARITRWYNDRHPTFMSLLDEVEQLVIENLETEVVAGVTEEINRLAPRAVSVMESIMEDPDSPTSARLSAAAHVLRFHGAGKVKATPTTAVTVEQLLKRDASVDSNPAVGD